MMAGVALQAAAANPSDLATLIELVLSATTRRSHASSAGRSGVGSGPEQAIHFILVKCWSSAITWARFGVAGTWSAEAPKDKGGGNAGDEDKSRSRMGAQPRLRRREARQIRLIATQSRPPRCVPVFKCGTYDVSVSARRYKKYTVTLCYV